MDWRSILLKKCSERGIEIQQEGNKAIFLCPRTPTEDEKYAIIGDMPVGVLDALTLEFVVSMKLATIQKIETLAKLSGLMAFNLERDPAKKAVTLMGSFMPNMEKNTDKLISDISEAIMKDGWADSWHISIGDENRTFNRKVIEDLSTRVISRDFYFTNDDVLNLRISLETMSVEDFINSI